MAVVRSSSDAQFASDAILQHKLPGELHDLVLTATGHEYLEAVALAALWPGCTERFFTYYRHLIPEIAARWSEAGTKQTSTFADQIKVLMCFAKIFPLARYLRLMIKSFWQEGRRFEISKLQSVGDDNLQTLLLAIFRLLSTEPENFSEIVKPTFLSRFLSHDSEVVRYLAIQCLCIVMRFADALEGKLVHEYVGNGKIVGMWEGKEIDFRLLKLFEEKRWSEFEREVKAIELTNPEPSPSADVQFTAADLASTTASVGGKFVPRDKPLQYISTSFVETPTAVQNLRSIGKSLLSQKPILVIGQGGSGKTALVRESARLLNQQSSMITLHLNEQTDAKSLLGIYTSSASGESFEWQPGVLTKAVQQGRWVLIEDIDRAPSEVLGVLRPIIENGQLFLPNRKEHMKPKEGFRVFATIKTSSKSERGNIGRFAWLANKRLWSVVEVEPYSIEEIKTLLSSRYPHITPILRDIIRAHEMVCEAYVDDPLFRAVQSRLPSLRDVLKWCRRTDQRIISQGLNVSSTGMPERVWFDIFKDGVDCYAAFHSNNSIFRAIAQRLARALNLSSQQMEHSLSAEISTLSESKKDVIMGRSVLQKTGIRRSSPKKTNFAMTNQAKRTIECIGAGTSHAEPLLLVGETGVGKTTQVQYIANLVNQKLTVVNLSQQSEAADLLGGLKPITTRSLILPLVDQFSLLFDDTFSSKRNEKFQTAISKALTKENWSRVVLLWQEAVQMAENSLRKPFEAVEDAGVDGERQNVKRRKLITKYGPLRDRWSEFSSKLNHVRAQVERGDKNHTFAFVEGGLVHAVRSGEWLLLDEINLASADTLDHIVSLLSNSDDEVPSLLLAEAGNIEHVTAHPNFRIFAAMNPATDTGKKDLAPGIRSRFTEIYVQSGDNDADDLVKIIETYLGPALSSDRRAALDLANAYLQLKSLNEAHKLTDGAGDVPHFSVRSLVRCLLYVLQHNASHGLRRSMYEGFAMSFFTVLSFESERSALPLLTNHLLSNVKNSRSFLAQQPRMSFDDSDYVAFKHHLVLRGPDQPDLQPHYVRTPSVERNLLNLARAASMRRFPILLQGPTSAGKTSMVEYLAKFSGNRFIRINNHEHTDLQEYLGSYATGRDGRLEFREGVLVEALRNGHWIVLDELNLAPSDVLEALNRLLDDNRELLVPETGEVLRPHPRFMLFATQNPAGLYGGRKRLSRAFRNRFLELHFDDIPEDELEVILRQRASIAPSFCTQIVQVYKRLSLLRQSTRLFESRNSFATLRDLFRWASRPVDDRQQLANYGFMLLGERVRDPAERQIVKAAIEETMKLKIDESELYGLHTIPEVIRRDSTVVWTLAMRRLFVLLSEALKNNEPVLLVGETGCGKTQICQTVAEAFQRTLSIYNAHSNTETGDLIGSQRPIRQRSELATALLDSFNQLYTSNGEADAVSNRDIDELIDMFDRIDTAELEPSIVEKTRQNIIAYRSLFTWSDGSLVRSMKSGDYFLLDEISLADDSVLERLNSVLEPSRTILLAEKGPIDSLVVADPNFQFLATMNPGGDYGKRELSAALRNRLTEIWVPPLSQSDDILPILRSKLGNQIEHYAEPMLGFAIWFKDNLQNSAVSTIPLRNLLTWAEFIKKSLTSDSDAAFVHGASMVYIDSLGANPAGLTTALGDDVQTARKTCLKKLQTLTSVDVLALYNEVPRLELTTNEARVGTFVLRRHGGETNVELVFDAPTTLKNTMRIVRALQMNRPILLEGSPGVGKTAIVTALAATIGKNLTRINLSDQTDLMDLFGADAPSEDEKLGRFSWRDGPLLQAMQTGGWVLLDEMNLASQSVLEGLNSCLDHRHEVYIAELDKSFVCHPDFTLFAAQNPHQQGGGRKGLPASFVNRFTVVYADPFETEDLMLICERTRPEVTEKHRSAVINTVSAGQELVAQSHAFSAGGPWELNLRDINRWLDLIGRSLSPRYHFEAIIAQRFRSPAAKAGLEKLYHKCLGDKPALSLHHDLSSEVFQVGTSFLRRDDQLQHFITSRKLSVDHLSYVSSVITAINHRWPVILVGPSGCGKTSLIRNLAALSGAELIELSMNADIDTMDLIGGFEQYDMRRDVLAVQRKICEILLKLITDCIVSTNKLNEAHFLISMFEYCSDPEIDFEKLTEIVASLTQRIGMFDTIASQLSQIASKAVGSRFVWNEGVLIDSLLNGSWLILDNANLCNPSVLDRLNSLLEPNGILAVSEQHSEGNKERVIVPHPNSRIFLTMDPKYGELSRAMRNRSLEIFMHSPIPSEIDSSMPSYPTSATIHRLRNLLFLSQPASGQAELVSTEPFVGLLSSHDAEKMIDYAQYLLTDETRVAHVRSYMKTFELVTPVVQNFWQQNLQNMFMESRLSSQMALLFVENQPQIPILNDAFCRATLKLDFPQLQDLTRRFFGQLKLAQLQRDVHMSLRDMARTGRDEMTILQKSVLSKQRGGQQARRNAIPDVSGFFNSIVTGTAGNVMLATPENDIKSLYLVVNLAKDILDLFNSRVFRQDIFIAYLEIAQNILRELSTRTTRYQHILEGALSSFDTEFMLQSGRSLQRMWLQWKPITATTYEQLKAQATVEMMIADFDEVARHFSHRRSELAVLRSQLSSACESVVQEVNPATTIATFTQALATLSRQKRSKRSQRGHFTAVFEWLLRRLIIQGKEIGELNFQRLSLFTELSPMSFDRNISSISSDLRRLAYLDNSTRHSPDVTGIQLFDGISTVKAEPLRSLNFACEELKELANSLSSHAFEVSSQDLHSILNCLRRLVWSMSKCHIDLFTAEARTMIASNEDVDFAKLASFHSDAFETGQISQVGDFKEIYLIYIQPILAVLFSQTELPSSYDVGTYLTMICVAALRLLTPDKMFDPAIYPIIVSERHQKRTAEMQTQIASYRDFQKRFTGQESSTVISVFERDLLDLGQVPATPAIYRPAQSELDLVQQEFSTVIRSVLGSNHLATILSCLNKTTDIGECVEACSIVEGLVLRVTDRLSRLNRAYDDIVKPVQWLLESLSFGTRLISSWQDQSRTPARTSILDSTPLLGGNPSHLTSRLPDATISKKQISMQWLEQVKLRGQVEQHLEQSTLVTTLDLIRLVDRFYVEWKTHLIKDQADAAASSKYFTYRGEDDAAQESDESELATLFPIYENDTGLESTSNENRYDARSTGIKLAELHKKLCINDISTPAISKHILGVLDTYTTWNAENHRSNLENLLPGIFLQMQKSITEVVQIEPKMGLNIYKDYDVVESRKLLDLVQRIQIRFEEIAQQWPEHAVPAEVLNYSDELLSFRIDEPIAKLMTKTEKLFEIVSQWQSVASREWSAADLSEALTDMIIHWRRLELSSWSMLLEIESKKAEDDANAWYFIAYEAILYNSRLIIDQVGDVTTHCQELAKTLEDFLRSTTLGQFNNRLSLLKIFRRTLDIISQEESRLAPITQCISSVIYHHDRYVPIVTETLSKGRAQLEKDITEQIKLASWKDTNIQSLRDSAKRSHHKLFKIVKKYRALLSQSLTSFKAVGVNMAKDLAPQQPLTASQPDVDHLISSLQKCATSISDWTSRPARLTDPIGAAMSMRKLYTDQLSDFSVSEELAAMRNDIATTSAELRKQTPASLTEENTSMVRHLRERKRRSLAETMRNVTQMGVRRNLATAELGKQSSVSAILAHSPDVDLEFDRKAASTANAAFHEILDDMSGVRKAAIEHSDDLTEGETRRAIGLLEGLLSIQMNQRADLAAGASGIQSFGSVVIWLNNLQTSGTNVVNRVQDNMVSKRQWIEKCLAWLPHILEVSCQILDFQSTQGGFDVNELVKTLQEEAQYLRDCCSQIEKRPKLPSGLATLEDQNQLEAIDQRLNKLNGLLVEWAERQPNISYLLKQITPWTTQFDVEEHYTNGVKSLDAHTLDSTLKDILDSVFVAMQKLIPVLSNKPIHAEDQGWLARTDKCFKDSVSSLHLQHIAQQLKERLLQLQHLPEQEFALGLSLVNVASPLLEQYYLIAKHLYLTQLGVHLETCRLGVLLTKSFISLASEGFCSPHDPADGQEQQSSKLEGGTGLGEGEGVDDISKDIGQDEDLSELAQANAEKQDGDQEIDKEKDAVDMGADDLEGEIGSEGERASDDEGDKQSGSDEEDAMDEEVGSVDDLDPSAVDEKLWDDVRTEVEKEEKELKGDKQNGSKTDDQTAKNEGQKEEGDEDMQGTEDGADDDDEAEGQERPEADNIDPRLQQEQALELPEEMQLTGEEEGQEDEISDDGMDEMSDIDAADQAEPENMDGSEDKDMQEQKDAELDDMDGDPTEEDEDAEGKAQDNEVIEDQDEDGSQGEDTPDARDNEMQYDVDENEGGETGTANQTNDALSDNQNKQALGQNEKEEVVNEAQTQSGQPSDQQQTGDASRGALEQGAGRENERQQIQDDALKRLAEVLEQYHQRREILTASEERRQGELDQDVDMNDADFEHVGEDELSADAQALGAASADQVQKIDESKAIEHHEGDAEKDLPMPNDQGPQDQEMQETMAERFSRLQNQPREPQNTNTNPSDLALATKFDDRHPPPSSTLDLTDETHLLDDDDDSHPSIPVLHPSHPTSTTDASTLWTQLSHRTHPLSLHLTEQLRLILSPTTATKLRGDFRTGKRLNIKRIIPYIASGYKRDKIWMRRTIPSKRSYQIMLAVDDSKSMAESGADFLALETVALLCKSLAMLEAGETCIVGFGDQEKIRVAHPFDVPFSPTESGPAVFRAFGFDQRGTDVRRLLVQSIKLFDDARVRAADGDRLWQLQLIVSDGHCSDHDEIRRLVRLARSKRIAVVFVIVDAGEHSIVDLKEAVFEPVDPTLGASLSLSSSSSSEMTVRTRRYLEGFPFGYYVVVREVVELPGVLCRVLKGWFEGVVSVE